MTINPRLHHIVAGQSYPLRKAFQTAARTAQATGYADWLAAADVAPSYIATRIVPKFGDSAEVIANRMRVEKVWPTVTT